MSAYKFRAICVHTEEKIYQFIEKNNLRLGESIDLSNLSNEHPDIKLENDNEALKEEADEFGDMPILIQESIVVQGVNDSSNVQISNNLSNGKGTVIQQSSLNQEVNERGNIQITNNAPNYGTKRKRNDENKASSNGQLVSDSRNVEADQPSKRPRRKLHNNIKVPTKCQSDSDSSTQDESNGLARYTCLIFYHCSSEKNGKLKYNI